MKKKNKIIALSGQPVTGKGTNVKLLVEKLKKSGVSEENIHVISTGEEFRKLFNLIMDFIRNLDNSETINEMAKKEEIREIFLNDKYREAFIDTLVQLKSKKIDLKNFSIEQANNLEEVKAIRNMLDEIIDEKIKKIGEEINKEERPDEVWIFDSRLAFCNIEGAMSVRLIADKEVAGRRLYEDTSRGEEDSKYANVEEAIEAREKRRIGEQKRYIEKYGVDLEDENNYDLVIDTSYSSVEDISETILKCLDCYTNNKPFVRNWTSPKTLLPLQRERDTIAESPSGWTLDKIVESIKENGYKLDEMIDVVEVDGIKYIIEGHHRNFASALLGKTLVPFEIVGKDDEKIKYYWGIARQRANSLTSDYLYGHEWFMEGSKGEHGKFSYEDIYPGIYDMIKNRSSAVR